MRCIYCDRVDCNGSCRYNSLGAQSSIAQASPAAINQMMLAQMQRQFSYLGEVQKKEPLENAGMKVEDLIGWRIWAISPSGLLKSFATNNIWLPDRPMEGTPGDHDSAGVWAFHHEDQAAAKLMGSPNHVMGSVRLWGHVVEHKLGFRAQFARIVSIDAVNITGKFPWDVEVERALTWLRTRYGLLRAFGQ